MAHHQFPRVSKRVIARVAMSFVTALLVMVSLGAPVRADNRRPLQAVGRQSESGDHFLRLEFLADLGADADQVGAGRLGVAPAEGHAHAFVHLVGDGHRLALDLGYDVLQVDASDDSRPILERLGLQVVGGTTPYMTRSGA